MKTLPTVIAAVLFGVAAAAVADEDSGLTTITVTAKRPHAGAAAADRAPPAGAIDVAAPMPTDMPEARIDFHMSPIAALPETAVRK